MLDLADLTRSSSLTILQATSPAVPLTKTFTSEGSKSYPNAYKFKAAPHSFDSIDSLYELIRKLQTNNKICVIRGALKSNKKEVDIQRKIRGEDARFEDKPSKLIHLDIDGVPAPEGMPMTSWAEYIISLLPVEFHESSYFSQYSSSAGVKEGIRLHIWFYSALSFDNVAFKRWYSHLPTEQMQLIDDAMFRPVQINYIAEPIFTDDRIDPVKDAGLERMKLVHKKYGTVALSIPNVAKPVPTLPTADIPDFEGHNGKPMKAFYRALWQIENSGRLHSPILQAFSAFKWACEHSDEYPSDDWCMERVREAIMKSPHIDKEGVYMTETYLDNQFSDANSGYDTGNYKEAEEKSFSEVKGYVFAQ